MPKRIGQEFSEWLKINEFSKYVDLFLDQEINFDVVAELTDVDLKDIGIAALGDRKRLLKAFNEYLQSPNDVIIQDTQEGERRQVTVLFADISGYTVLSSKKDPEDVHCILNKYFSIVDGVIREHGGTIDKHIGDAVMAVFGAPVAHTDDPIRAVYAAIEIQSRLKKLAPPIPVHIGIASGEVVASNTGSDKHQEYTVTGSTVNLASRLDGLANTGETFVNDEVYQAVSKQIDGITIGDVDVKGFDTPVMVWSILGQRELVSSNDTKSTIRMSGRTSECQQFEDITERCFNNKAGGHFFYLRGEPGIGKSCLAENYQQISKRKGYTCHEASILDFGSTTGREAIRHIACELLNPDGLFSEEVIVDKALGSGLITKEHETHVYSLLEILPPPRLAVIYDAMDNNTRQQGRHATLIHLVSQTTKQQPQFVLIENLHWADTETLLLLKSLTQQTISHPLILVLTTRVTDDPWQSVPEIEQYFKKAATKITLGPLDRKEAIEMAKNHGLTNEEFAVQCWERSGGNPLFLEQLYRSSFDKTSKTLPPTVQSVVLTRMDSLDKKDRQALQAASIMGHRFSLKFLQSLICDTHYTCDELVRCALVHPDGDNFQFSHALVADGVYNSLLNKQRQYLHQQVAALYAANNPVLYAQHLDRGNRPEAIQAYIEAVRHETSHYRFDKSLQFIKRALEITVTNDERIILFCMRGDVLLSLGHPEKSHKSYNNALEISTAPEDQLRALIGGAAASRILGVVQQGLHLLDKAEGIAKDFPLNKEKAQIYYYRGTLLFSHGDVENSLLSQEQSIKYAKKSHDLKSLAQGLSGLGDAQYARGRFKTAYRVFLQCLDICQTSGFGEIEVANCYMVSNMRRYMNEFTTATMEMNKAVEMTQQVGNLRAEMMATLLLGEFQIDATDYDGSIISLDRAHDIINSFGNKRLMAYVLDHKARAYLGLNNSSEASKSIEEAWNYSCQTDHSFLGARICGTKAILAENQATRTQALVEGEKIIRKGVFAHNYIWFLRDAIESSINAQDFEPANRYISKLKEITQPEPIPWCDFFIERGELFISLSKGKSSQEQINTFIKKIKNIGLLSALPIFNGFSS
ncbi:MAG: adenylate/guanylate cyclase domain-containing protein [Halopseudomonas aestusnigri]